jgi:hypothetical protein
VNEKDLETRVKESPERLQRLSEFLPTRPVIIRAQPFVWRDPRTIKPRQWLHAKHYIRGFVSATIAPGGLGKSSLQLVETVGMTAGRDLLRGTAAKMPLKVWYWNLEDPREEIDRRIAAIMLHYKIHPGGIEGRLFVNSGRDKNLVIAEMQRGAAIVHLPVAEALKAEIARLGIDVLTVDPSFHVTAFLKTTTGRLTPYSKHGARSPRIQIAQSSSRTMCESPTMARLARNST